MIAHSFLAADVGFKAVQKRKKRIVFFQFIVITEQHRPGIEPNGHGLSILRKQLVRGMDFRKFGTESKTSITMQTQKLIFPLIFLAAGLLTSCGGSENTSATTESTETSSSSEGTSSDDPAATMEKAMSDAMKQLGGDGETKEVVDFRELKALLPERIAGMDRTSHTGEKVGAMGFKMSTAQAEYENGDQSLDVSVVDFAGVSMILASTAAWASVEIDKETESGYERTTTIDGYKAFEEYDSKRKAGQISIIAEDRYIITIEGRNIEEGALREALDAVSSDKLKGLE